MSRCADDGIRDYVADPDEEAAFARWVEGQVADWACEDGEPDISRQNADGQNGDGQDAEGQDAGEEHSGEPDVQAQVSALKGLVDWLRSVAPDDTRGPEATRAEMIDLIATLEGGKGPIAAAQARATHAFARTTIREALAARRTLRTARRGIAPQIALARRCSPSLADRHLSVARALTEMPHTRAALTAGIIDEAAAAAVVHQTSPLSDEHRAAVDELVAPRFAGAIAREIGKLAARHAAELDPASIVAKHRKAVSERGVWTRPAPDGMAYLSVFGPLPDVVGALASLRGYANGVLGGHHEEDDPPAERTHAQIMADTALRLLSGRTAGQTQPVHIGLLMRPESLLGHAQDDPDRCVDRPAWVVGHGPLPAALARRLLLRGCDAADDSSDAGHQNFDDLTPDDLTSADARPADPMPGEPAHTLIQRIFTSRDGRDLVGLESSARLPPRTPVGADHPRRCLPHAILRGCHPPCRSRLPVRAVADHQPRQRARAVRPLQLHQGPARFQHPGAHAAGGDRVRPRPPRRSQHRHRATRRAQHACDRDPDPLRTPLPQLRPTSGRRLT